MTNSIDLLKRTKQLPKAAERIEIGSSGMIFTRQSHGFLWQTKVAELVRTRACMVDFVVMRRLEHQHVRLYDRLKEELEASA